MPSPLLTAGLVAVVLLIVLPCPSPLKACMTKNNIRVTTVKLIIAFKKSFS